MPRDAEQVYADVAPRLIAWLLEQDDVVDAERRNVYTVRAKLHSGERVDIAMQWLPPGGVKT